MNDSCESPKERRSAYTSKELGEDSEEMEELDQSLSDKLAGSETSRTPTQDEAIIS
eukprot:CAMPEP_0183579416 /NCGR_PEP_ID=MMETSP0371-20130417/143745_1 /TAXON_ID=268820 /ORGANISM="Peridinium aciculiferum, Strain PAER-2" /LENGTH=55 /DNA_ID=CAMNT_0025789929 /DNA_START=45 /DNA_END=209 /DNA_ORIENTATION=-